MRRKNLIFLLTFSLVFSTVDPLLVNAEDAEATLTFEESVSFENESEEDELAFEEEEIIEDESSDILEEESIDDSDAEPEEEQTIEEIDQAVSEAGIQFTESQDSSILAGDAVAVQDLTEETVTDWNEIPDENLAYRYVGTILQIKLLDPDKSQGSADYTSSKMPRWNSDSDSAKAATRIEIQSGITRIGERWFYSYGQGYFQKVTEVDLPSSVKVIGISAFDGGLELRSIELKDVETIASSAFQRTGIEQISLDNVTNIGAAAFNDCANLRLISFGQENITIAKRAFSSCPSLSTGVACYVGNKEKWDNIGKTERASLKYIPTVHCKGENVAEAKEPTCTETGVENKTCAICNGTYSVEVAALGHDYATEFTTDVEPTCTEAGSESNHCTRCDVTDPDSTREIPALGHEWEMKVDQEPTCTEAGSESNHCTRCDATDPDSAKEIPALGHEWEKKVDQEPTCTEPGSESNHCTRCDAADPDSVKEIPALGHDYVSTVTTQPTCVKDGVRTYTCSRCKDTKTEAISALGHDYKSEVTTQPTCTKDGVRTYTCSRCKDAKAETIPATGVHQWSSWKKTADATVFVAEQQERTCGICGRKETQTVGNKLTATATVKVSSVTLKEKQSISSVKVTGMAKGDSVKTWKSTNTKVFTVAGKADGTCKLTGVKKGTAKLEITLASGLKKTVTVKVQAKTITTSKISGLAKKITVKKGAKTTLKPVITPSTSQQKVTYSSSNKSVATVSSKGVITAKKAGTAKITVKSGSKQVTVTVTVPKTKTTAITVGKKVSVKKGKTYSLKAKVKPSNSDEKITYSTSNKKIATVSKSGKIKGVKKGTATITVKSGKITKKVKVTVK